MRIPWPTGGCFAEGKKMTVLTLGIFYVNIKNVAFYDNIKNITFL
jgi:hypothetical protein